MASCYHAGWCLLLIDFGHSQPEVHLPFQLDLHFFSYIGLSVVFGAKLPWIYPSATIPPAAPLLKIRTHKHFLILAHSNPLPFDNLDILQSAQDFMLYHECRLDAEHRALFDCEWLAFESINSSRCRKIHGNITSTLDFEGEGFDDTFPGVGGVGDRFARAQA